VFAGTLAESEPSGEFSHKSALTTDYDDARRRVGKRANQTMLKIEDRLEFIGLNADARAVLRESAPVVAPALQVVLAEFYREVLPTDRLSRFFANDAVVAHARAAQIRHWKTILKAEFDEAYLQSAMLIGQAHHRIGLEPRDYIAGYAKLLGGLTREVETRMSGWRKRRRRQALQDALMRAALLDMDLALAVYISRSSDDQRQNALRDMCEVLEADVDGAVAEVLTLSDDSKVRGERAASNAGQIAADAGSVANSSQEVKNSVNSVSAATESLSLAGREIAERAAQTAQFANRAVQEVERATNTVTALNDSAGRIGSVVTVIAEVAAQTNLLALNATIEAARAGEAGRGFAIVAHEVKALAQKTAEAAEDIKRRVADIQSAAGEGVDFIKKIGAGVGSINDASVSVALSAEQQDATLTEIVSSLREGTEGVAAVARNIANISDRSSEIESESRLVAKLVNGTNGRISELRANLVVSLRAARSRGLEAPDYQRPVSVPARIRGSQGAVISGAVLELSEISLRFRADESGFVLEEGEPVVIGGERIGEFSAKVLTIGDTSVHLAFSQLADGDRKRLEAYLHAIDDSDRTMVDAVSAAARRIEAAFEEAIKRGRISDHGLFDFTYRLIAGTDPEQYEAPFTALCDSELPAIQEQMLARDPRVVFCAAVDRNAYLPTHNAKFSLPQRPNDPLWNAANSRNRRFFKDRAGLTAGRTTRKFLIQSYDRNMGGGVTVTLKEIDVPLYVGGKHWGGLRLAFRV
jgi:methyl-accepting chemotaxis protein